MLITMVAIVSFAVAATTTFHTRTVLLQQNQTTAHQFAESALSAAINALCVDQRYGQDRIATVRLGTPQAGGLMTFNVPTAAANGLPWSLNNWVDSAAAVPNPQQGSRELVPGGAIDLFAAGWSFGEHCTLEEMVWFPPYNEALAASQSVSATNTLIGSLRSIDDVPRRADGSVALTQDNLLPGSCVCNGGNAAAV
ncbi:MAG: hypothetical protein ACYCW6_22890, partial [Candidatus Xenobia bacterium]